MRRTILAKKIDFTNNFDIVNTKDGLNRLVETLYNSDKLIGFDIETGYSGSPYPERAVNVYHPLQFIAGFSITNDVKWARYIPLKHDFGENLDPNVAWEIMKPLLEDKSGVAHNLLFEAENLRALDLKGDGPRIDLPVSKWHDSMISAFVLGDVPPSYIDGALRDGEFVRSYIPEFHRTSDGFQSHEPGRRAFQVRLKSLTRFRYNYDQADIFSLFNGGKDLTTKEKKQIRFNTLPIDPKVVHYACDDAYLCLQLHLDQYQAIQEDRYLPAVYKLEMRTAEVLHDMRENGIEVDWEGLNRHKELKQSFLHEMSIYVRKSFEEEVGRDLTTLNFGSPKQMRDLLYGRKEVGGMGLDTDRLTDTKQKSTDEIALENLKHRSASLRKLLALRRANKMGQWVESWCDLENQTYSGKIHPSFMQTVVASGRFASSGPNVQNVTKQWWYQSVDGTIPEVMGSGVNGKEYWTGNARDFIIASPDYYLLSFDYKSAEIQMLAAISGETSVIDAFYSGDDFHKWTASLVFNKKIEDVSPSERQAAKTISFAIAYGSSVASIAESLGISVPEAQKIYDDYMARFSKMKKFIDKQHQLVEATSEVRTWLGRKVTVWENMSSNRKTRSRAKRLGVNAPVQGGATGDYPKLAMINVRKALIDKGWWKKEVRLLMNQHDSLVFEVHKSIDLNHIIEFLTPLVSFNLKGIEGFYNKFDSFPPMGIDWEVGYKWGSLVSPEDFHVLHSDKLNIELADNAKVKDLQTVLDVVRVNPGNCPTTLIYKGQIRALPNVKASPSVLSKLSGGDPDIGITHSPKEFVRAEFLCYNGEEKEVLTNGS